MGYFDFKPGRFDFPDHPANATIVKPDSFANADLLEDLGQGAGHARHRALRPALSFTRRFVKGSAGQSHTGPALQVQGPILARQIG